MNTKILDRNAPVLRQVAKDVPLALIPSKKIKGVLGRMKRALAKEEDGVAIAAPQIGESLRIFVVSGRVQLILSKDTSDKIPSDLVFINPSITKLSKKKSRVEEGCLSLRWLYGKVLRCEKATVTAYDEKGKKFTRGASGLMAQIYQHEVDHLNGILFTDKATDVVDLPPEIQKTHGKK